MCAFMSALAKSKCSRFSCWGVVVERNVHAELESERLAAKMRAGTLPTPGVLTRQGSKEELSLPSHSTVKHLHPQSPKHRTNFSTFFPTQQV